MVLVVIGLGAVAVMNRGNPKAEDTSTPTKNHEKFHKSVQPFVKELRGLLGRMDAGLSFFDFNQKLGDLAAAYRGIADAQDGPSERDRDRAEKAYKAFIAVRKAWGEKIANSNAPDMRETFDLACEEAAAQARVFLQHHEVGEE